MRVSLVSGDEGLRSVLTRLARQHSFLLIDEPHKADLLIWDFGSALPPSGWSAEGVDYVVLLDPGDAAKLAASGCPPGIRVVFKPIREAELEAVFAKLVGLRKERDVLLQRLLRAKARSASSTRGRVGPASAFLLGCQRAV